MSVDGENESFLYWKTENDYYMENMFYLQFGFVR